MSLIIGLVLNLILRKLLYISKYRRKIRMKKFLIVWSLSVLCIIGVFTTFNLMLPLTSAKSNILVIIGWLQFVILLPLSLFCGYKAIDIGTSVEKK